MSNWQYCDDCDAALNPTPEQVVDGYMVCEHCGTQTDIVDGAELKNDLLKDLLSDVAKLKETQT